MYQNCMDKIKKEIVPILGSIPDRYKNSCISENFHIFCYFHCVNNLPKNKHNEFINKCIDCVKVKKEYCNELEAYKFLKQEFINKKYVYYLVENFEKNFKNVSNKYDKNKTKFLCPVDRKRKQMTELKNILRINNLEMKEHLLKLNTGIVVQLTRKRDLEIQKFMVDCLDEFLEEQIEEDILKVASQLV